jgi:hypothetical protein
LVFRWAPGVNEIQSHKFSRTVAWHHRLRPFAPGGEVNVNLVK